MRGVDGEAFGDERRIAPGRMRLIPLSARPLCRAFYQLVAFLYLIAVTDDLDLYVVKAWMVLSNPTGSEIDGVTVRY